MLKFAFTAFMLISGLALHAQTQPTDRADGLPADFPDTRNMTPEQFKQAKLEYAKSHAGKPIPATTATPALIDVPAKGTPASATEKEENSRREAAQAEARNKAYREEAVRKHKDQDVHDFPLPLDPNAPDYDAAKKEWVKQNPDLYKQLTKPTPEAEAAANEYMQNKHKTADTPAVMPAPAQTINDKIAIRRSDFEKLSRDKQRLILTNTDKYQVID